CSTRQPVTLAWVTTVPIPRIFRPVRVARRQSTPVRTSGETAWLTGRSEQRTRSPGCSSRTCRAISWVTDTEFRNTAVRISPSTTPGSLAMKSLCMAPACGLPAQEHVGDPLDQLARQCPPLPPAPFDHLSLGRRIDGHLGQDRPHRSLDREKVR